MYSNGRGRIFDRNEESPGEIVRTNSFTHLVYAIINIIIIGIGLFFLISISKLFFWMIPIVLFCFLGMLLWIYIKKSFFSLMITIFSYVIMACVFLTILALLDIWGFWWVIGIALFEFSLIFMNYYDSHPGTVILNE